MIGFNSNDMNVSYLTKYKKSLILLLIFTILHIPLLFLGPVNIEFAFSDLLKYFKNGNEVFLEQFFFYQANTVGMSFLGWLVNIEGLNIDEILLIRILNLFGSVIFILSLISISNFFRIKNIFFITLFIVISPLFWTYSSRATADLLPAALVLLSYSLFLKNNDFLYMIIVSALIFGVALVLKPLIIFMYIFFIGLYFVDKKKFTLIKLMIFCSISFFILIFFLLHIYLNFNYLITSDKFLSVLLKTSLTLSLNNFILYTGYITLAISPMIILGNYSKSLYRGHFFSILFYLVIFVIGYLYINDTGEMNFSFLETVIPKSIFNGILMIGTIIFFNSFYFNKKYFMHDEKARKYIYFFISIVISLVFLSLLRPSQRYILILLPFCLFLLPEINFKNKKVLYTFAAIIFSIDITISLNQYLKSSASKNMLEYIINNEMIAETNPGAITGSYGNYFFLYKDKEKKYIVVNYNDEDSLFYSSKNFLFIEHNYSLVEFKN